MTYEMLFGQMNVETVIGAVCVVGTGFAALFYILFLDFLKNRRNRYIIDRHLRRNRRWR